MMKESILSQIKRSIIMAFLLCSGLVTSSLLSGQTTLNFSPSKDCSIFLGNSIGSNGAGSLFAGRTDGNLGSSNRRALIKFDITGIPANAVVTSVTFSITGNRGGGGLFAVHRLTADWGEGSTLGAGTGGGRPSAAQAGDATWSARFLGTSNWSSAGGDFIGVSSATGNITGTGTANFSNSSLISDVQGWIDGSHSNHGWILIGSEGIDRSAVRMNSRESPTQKPNLSITYVLCPTMLTLAGNIASDTYDASQNITATGTIASISVVVLNSGIDIILNPEFTIDDGGVLNANIQACN